VTLELLAGLPGDGVPRLVRDAVSVAARAGRTVLLAVPSDEDAIIARSLLSASSPVGVRVATLEGVVEAEWALLGDGRRLAGGLGRDVLLRRALVAAGISQNPGPGAVGVLGALVDRSAHDPRGAANGKGLPGRLVAAVAGYRRSLAAHGMIERADACDRLAASPPADVIAVDGFVDLPREFETLLNGWSAAGAEVSLSVAGRPDREGAAASRAMVGRMRSGGASVRTLEERGGSRAPELERARRELFEGTEPSVGAGAVSLAVTSGEEGEARYIARAVAGLMRNGARPDDVVVVFGDPARHAAWVKRAMCDEGIEADIRASVGVGESAFGAALLRLRSSALDGLSREDMAALVHNAHSGVAMARADQADATWRRGGATRGRTLLREVPSVGPLIAELLDLWRRPIGASEAMRWKKLADRMLANGLAEAAPVPADDALLDAAVHRAFCRSVQEALGLGEGEVCPDELWECFSSSRVMPAGSTRAGRVSVTSVDAAPAEGCAHLVIGGLTASELPRRGGEDRLEGDAVLQALRMLGSESDESEHALEERRAFFLAVAAPRESLTLVRRGSDEEGSPMRESVFWDEFLDLYRAPGTTQAPEVLPRIISESAGAAEPMGHARQARGELCEDSARAELAAISEVSPSEIESYLSCPYKWFVERRVRAQSPDRALDAAAAGRLAHESLARFYREWCASSPRRVTPEVRESAMELAARVAQETLRSAGEADTLEGMALLDLVAPSVVALVGRDAFFLPGCTPTHIEWAFGRSSEMPAMDLGGVALVGRADRIDIGPEGLVIVDYKRTHASTLSQIRASGLVQLQLYAAAASQALGLPVAGGVYRSLKDGSDRGFVLECVGSFSRNDVVSREGLDDLIAEGIAAALDAAGSMREGRIQPTPSADACAYCSAASFCGRAVTR
jgi:RecB family exonuclease